MKIQDISQTIQFLSCPICKVKLNSLTCTSCQMIYSQKEFGPSFIYKAEEALERTTRDKESTQYDKFQTNLKGASFITLQSKLINKELNSHKRQKIKTSQTSDIEIILDSGCGTGLLTQDLIRNHEMNRFVYALDFSESSLYEAFKKLKRQILFIHADTTNLPFNNLFFDSVVSSLVLQHLNSADRSRTYQEFYRTLKKDGILIFTVFNSKRFKNMGLSSEGVFPNGNPYFSFTPEMIRKELSRENFETLKIKPLGCFLFLQHIQFRGAYRLYRILHFFLNFLERLLYPFLSENISSDYLIIIARPKY